MYLVEYAMENWCSIIEIKKQQQLKTMYAIVIYTEHYFVHPCIVLYIIINETLFSPFFNYTFFLTGF